MGKSAKQNWFEFLIFGITIAPFIFLWLNWEDSIVNSAKAVYAYLFTTTVFYFFSVWFAQLDSRKENYEELLPGIRQIRLIWASFIAIVGLVLFVHSIYEHQFNFIRLTGVIMSLFLFAVGNFQGRLHPSSAFSSNRWQVNGSTIRKSQRSHARIRFWSGLLATIIFLTLQDAHLFIGFFFITVAVIYGLAFRLINGFSLKG
ncbi:MAG: hypothetical protein NWP83_08225 [Spirosomaceae bacterium]|nr:hypothetical protein [Spirosomataceae bacterium]